MRIWETGHSDEWEVDSEGTNRTWDVPAPDGRIADRTAVIELWATKINDADLDVCAWRRAHLNDTLLDATRVHGWVAEIFPRALPLAWPHARRLPEASDELLVPPAHPICERFLEWIQPGPEPDEWIRRGYPVPAWTPLGELAELSGRLATTWGWRPAEATMYLCSSWTPRLPAVRGTYNYRAYETSDLATKGETLRVDIGTRATIELDPLLTPKDLAAWWSEAREVLLVNRRVMPSPRDRRLASLAADLQPLPSPADRLKGKRPAPRWERFKNAWNKAHPKKGKITHTRQVRTDVPRAIRKLLHAGYTDPELVDNEPGLPK